LLADSDPTVARSAATALRWVNGGGPSVRTGARRAAVTSGRKRRNASSV
jgi:hypothetical protein